jgi:hypothetical protein
MFTDTYLNIVFSKSNYWNYTVFPWSDARLTSAGCDTEAVSESVSLKAQFRVTGVLLCRDPPRRHIISL